MLREVIGLQLMKDKQPKTLLISSNYAWTIFNFRMSLLRRLKYEGYRVVVLTQFDGYEKNILKEVDQVIPLLISRKGLNPFFDILTIYSFIKHIWTLKPDLLLLYTIKPVIYGSLAARLTRVKSISMITGLGTVFIENSWVTKLVKKLYKISLYSATTTFFQNLSDKDLFVESKIIKNNTWKITPGSGLDLKKFQYIDLPNETELVFLFVGRLLGDKGVREFIKAARVIKLKFPRTVFQLLGPASSENRTAISISEINEWVQEGIVEYLGETDDIIFFLARASCVVLPSYREGTSKALLEAAAVGRPLIASDVPGCSEIIEDGKTGFLCKVKDHIDLALKMENMLILPYQSRKIMGKLGRKKVEEEFNENIVNNLYLNAIENELQN